MSIQCLRLLSQSIYSRDGMGKGHCKLCSGVLNYQEVMLIEDDLWQLKRIYLRRPRS